VRLARAPRWSATPPRGGLPPLRPPRRVSPSALSASAAPGVGRPAAVRAARPGRAACPGGLPAARPLRAGGARSGPAPARARRPARPVPASPALPRPGAGAPPPPPPWGLGGAPSLPRRRGAPAPRAAANARDPGADRRSLGERARGALRSMDGLWGEFLPMVALFFFMAFVNTVIDSLKDTLVVTSVGGGPQVIPFLTVYAVLPASLLFFAVYSLGTQRFTRVQMFNAVVAAFTVFFAAFAFVAFPRHEALHLSFLDAHAAALPSGLQGLVGMARNWTFTTFYVASELWGDIVLSLMFWGLANDITSLDKARVLYPLFGLGANIAQVAAGRFLKMCGVAASAAGTSLQDMLQVQVGACIGSCVMVLATHAYIMRKFEAQQAPRRKDVRVAGHLAKGRSPSEAQELAGYESDVDCGVGGSGGGGGGRGGDGSQTYAFGPDGSFEGIVSDKDASDEALRRIESGETTSVTWSVAGEEPAGRAEGVAAASSSGGAAGRGGEREREGGREAHRPGRRRGSGRRR